MTSSYNQHYIPHQGQIPETTKPVIPEERPSKKVQFSSSNQQQQTSAFKPLTNTQSWHESSDVSAQTTGKHVPLSNRSSLPRTSVVMPKTLSTRPTIEKPIYIGVDFQATLAERGQTNSSKRNRRNGEKSHSDGLNSSTNIHTVHPHSIRLHKHQTPTGSPKSNIETSLHKSSDSQRTVMKSRSGQNIEQSNEFKSVKSRHHHRQQQQQQPSMNNEVKRPKSRESHRRHHHQHSSSPASIQHMTRQNETKQSDTPVMRIPLSSLNHHHQREPVVLSSATKMKVHRTPIQI